MNDPIDKMVVDRWLLDPSSWDVRQYHLYRDAYVQDRLWDLERKCYFPENKCHTSEADALASLLPLLDGEIARVEREVEQYQRLLGGSRDNLVALHARRSGVVDRIGRLDGVVYLRGRDGVWHVHRAADVDALCGAGLTLPAPATDFHRMDDPPEACCARCVTVWWRQSVTPRTESSS